MKPEYIDLVCHSCVPLAINGHPCHEIGCPESDYVPDGSGRLFPVDCFECGFRFTPEVRGERVCPGCEEMGR